MTGENPPTTREYVRAAVEFCEALTAAAARGVTLPEELSNLAALENLCNRVRTAHRSEDEVVAQLAKVYCFNARRALDQGLEDYQFLRDANDAKVLSRLAHHLRAQAERVGAEGILEPPMNADERR